MLELHQGGLGKVYAGCSQDTSLHLHPIFSESSSMRPQCHLGLCWGKDNVQASALAAAPPSALGKFPKLMGTAAN